MTHDKLTQAIAAARKSDEWHDVDCAEAFTDGTCDCRSGAEVAHLDTLQAILDYANDLLKTDYRGAAPKEFSYAHDLRVLVESALRNMGVLD